MAVTQAHGATTHSEAAPPRPRNRWTAPGWYRAGWMFVLGWGVCLGVDVLIRALLHYHPVLDGQAIVTVALIFTPFFFLVGLGAFDYWFYWASGKPTRAEDHSSH